MHIFNTDHCLQLSLASIHHKDGTYGLEKFQQDFNQALSALNVAPIDWSNLLKSPNCDLNFTTYTTHVSNQILGFKYRDTEYCQEQCWESDQLEIYLDYNQENLIKMILIAIVLKEQTDSHAYLELGTAVDSMLGGGDSFELNNSASIAEVINKYRLGSRFVDYLKSLNDKDESTITIEVSAPAGEIARLSELNYLVKFSNRMNPRNGTTLVSNRLLNSTGSIEISFIAVGEKSALARYHIATTDTGNKTLIITADYNHNSKLMLTKLAELTADKFPDLNITMVARNERYTISNPADAQNLLTKLNKSPIY